MDRRILLFWLRENGRDMGTSMVAGDLDPAIRGRVLALAAEDAGDASGPLELRLPFLDRWDSRRRAEILRNLTFVREGRVIRGIPATRNGVLRDYAATLRATHPAWLGAPGVLDRAYFQTWQRVSVALQRKLRQWIPEAYFRDPARYEDRGAAYPLLVYIAGRVCYGRGRTEFTYDIADAETMPRLTHMIASALQGVLRCAERRLHEDGRHTLARRYAPVWYEDVLREVRNRPQPVLTLLAQEAALINAVISLGSSQNLETVKPFANAATQALRRMYGEDLRPLAVAALDEATKELSAVVAERSAPGPTCREAVSSARRLSTPC